MKAQAAGIQLLDYDKHEIQLVCQTQAEEEMRIRSCAKEPESVRFLESFEPNSVFIDIGANVGAYSLVAAALGHQVIAVEPHPPTFKRLQTNIGLNSFGDNISPWRLLLWSSNEYVSIQWSGSDPGVAEHRMGSGDRVRGHRLDDLVAKRWVPQPRYVKLDTDGSEPEVLEGATETLAKVEGIQVEFDDSLEGHNRRIHKLLESLGFRQTSWSRHGTGPISNVRYDMA